LKILKYYWKNFNSYGNMLQSLDFSESISSLNLISANNGNGKSTIAEVLEFGIFGRVSGKKIYDLPNRVNENLYTKTHIQTKQGELSIERNVSPNNLNVVLNDVVLSDIAGKKNVQQQIENDILDIDQFMFKNLVVLDINKFKSFVRMKKQEKRNLIDRVFGLNILTMMHEEIKNEIKDNQRKENSLKDNIDSLYSHIQLTQNKTDEIQKQIDDAQKIEEATLKESIADLSGKEQILREKFELINKNINEIKEKIKKNDTVKKGYEFDKKSIEKKIELYERNEKCPMCGSDFNSAEHLDHLEDYKNQLTLLTRTLVDLKSEGNKHSERLDKYMHIRDEGTKKIHGLSVKIDHLQTEIEKLNLTDNSYQLNGLYEIIEQDQKSLETHKEKLETIQYETNFLNIISDILSEQGIKKHIIDKIIPHLNNEINKMLSRLNLGYSLNLDSNLETNVVFLGRDLSIETLSAGESKKFDFAVLIGFIRLLKTKFSDINILFLDEIFSSLDMESIELVCGILKEISTELNLHIFLINHSLLDFNLFDRVINVHKDKTGFSYLENSI